MNKDTYIKDIIDDSFLEGQSRADLVLSPSSPTLMPTRFLRRPREWGGIKGIFVVEKRAWFDLSPAAVMHSLLIPPTKKFQLLLSGPLKGRSPFFKYQCMYVFAV